MARNRPTLLEALATGPVFRGRTEDLAVEALGHILSTSEAARAGLADILTTGGAPGVAVDRVRTQVAGDQGARPDLAAFDGNGRERVLIEAKFGAGLTSNQPVAYLERLSDEHPSALLFVAPAARVEPLWVELCRRVSAPKVGHEMKVSRKTGAVRSAVASRGTRRLMLTSWRHLIGRMQAQAATVSDSQAQADLRQLRGLARLEDENVFRPLRSGEMSKHLPQRVLLLACLVEDATEAAKTVGWVRSARTQPQPWGYGRHLQLGTSKVWLGIHVDRWARLPTAPLWLWFSEDSLQKREKTRVALQPLSRKKPCELFDDDAGGLLVPVELPAEVGYEAVLEAVVTRLDEIARVIGATKRRRRARVKAQSRIDPKTFPPLRREEMLPDLPRRLVELRRLVDDAAYRAEGSDWADSQGLNKTPQRWGYGRYMRLAGAQVWFGIDFNDWLVFPPDTPLWLWFTPNSLRRREKTRAALEPLQGKNPLELFDDLQGGLLVPILLPAEREYDGVLEAVVDRLEEVARVIGGRPPARSFRRSREPSLVQRIWGVGQTSR